MLLSIEPASDVPLYLQLRNQLVGALVHGELKEGDSLPSVRQLAVDLGINLHTVNKAYKVLQDEGFLKIYGRKGAVITAPPTLSESYLAELEAKLSRLYVEARSHGVDAALFARTVQAAQRAIDEQDPIPNSNSKVDPPDATQLPTVSKGTKS
ncbi:MAG: GntR family transcriptional regulator [Propionibacteriaceae bacterium]|jgi:GntR family transcriptional regulator|nr:GntR family transcriptional regulator [Propionibacteriaceae bacterium]